MSGSHGLQSVGFEEFLVTTSAVMLSARVRNVERERTGIEPARSRVRGPFRAHANRYASVETGGWPLYLFGGGYTIFG